MVYLNELIVIKVAKALRSFTIGGSIGGRRPAAGSRAIFLRRLTACEFKGSVLLHHRRKPHAAATHKIAGSNTHTDTILLSSPAALFHGFILTTLKHHSVSCPRWATKLNKQKKSKHNFFIGANSNEVNHGSDVVPINISDFHWVLHKSHPVLRRCINNSYVFILYSHSIDPHKVTNKTRWIKNRLRRDTQCNQTPHRLTTESHNF